MAKSQSDHTTMFACGRVVEARFFFKACATHTRRNMYMYIYIYWRFLFAVSAPVDVATCTWVLLYNTGGGAEAMLFERMSTTVVQ